MGVAAVAWVSLAVLSTAAPALAANPRIVVTSGVDDGTDGAATTLREAFAIAAKRPGPDRIVVGPKLYLIALEDTIRVSDGDPVTFDADPDDDGVGQLYAYMRFERPMFEVAKGTDLTVVGAHFDIGGVIGTAGNTGTQGVWGEGGAPGESHGDIGGDDLKSAPGGRGGNGTPGLAGGSGGKADPVGGKFVNHGRLTLVRTTFGRFHVVGGYGGLGGGGGRGGNGGYGGSGGNAVLHQDDTIDPSVKAGGAGGAGGNGGDGGRGGTGGRGGDAGGAIFNDKGAVTTLVDVAFGGRSAYFGYLAGGGEAVGGAGGRGGSGGSGGNAGGGGVGGRGGVKGLPAGGWEKIPRGTFGFDNGGTYDPCLDSEVHPCGFTAYTVGGRGGAGGRGGDAGTGGIMGAGGDAAGAILNYGKVTGTAAVTSAYVGTGGAGGDPLSYHGFGGTVGDGGLGGLHKAGRYFLWEYTGMSFVIRYQGDLPTAADGRDGKAGADAPIRPKGPAGRGVSGILTKGSGAVGGATVAAAVAYVHDLGRGTDANGKPVLSFNVIRLGDVSAATRIRWRVVPGGGARPVSAGDFAAGALPSGTVSLVAIPGTAQSDPTKNAVRVVLPLAAAALKPAGKTYRVELLSRTGTTTVLGTDTVDGAL
ncbi:hypothetical protein [Oharaeibacter diazotrophicus]|uniref:PE-PGRS family protein n=1 Tax=Oharaeibacter diazotrophicus TaxID=1920512 RepID=A0A4R6RAN5_9HYPH|nr:hypothetical protein [Oharaeibacter diazotrophicus]TDP83191.1 hypothetical protein EDD54_3148 [Oharaeibacter diazotrophicus]BBE72020.1 hypothetical protein OHA_1_01607 [Pleomorphomonas sp. SM30]GLS78785.1 hypothetical protein GCM10007904_41220 [Oharaeibacter diazotrophicus]